VGALLVWGFPRSFYDCGWGDEDMLLNCWLSWLANPPPLLLAFEALLPIPLPIPPNPWFPAVLPPPKPCCYDPPPNDPPLLLLLNWLIRLWLTPLVWALLPPALKLAWSCALTPGPGLTLRLGYKGWPVLSEDYELTVGTLRVLLLLPPKEGCWRP